MRKKLGKMVAVMIAGIMGYVLVMSPVDSTKAVYAEDSEESESQEEEICDDFEWEVYDIGTPDEWENAMESDSGDNNANNGIALYTVYDLPGTWIQEADGRWWYRHENDSYTTNDWERINNRWYYFDNQGYMFVGWLNLNATWYYLDESGAMQTGWIWSNGKYYYCDGSGAMQTGWVLDNGKWYYCSESNNGCDGSWVDNTGTQMIQEALKYVGNPYVYGGNSLTSGTDCSGYVKLISEKFGMTLPRTAAEQYSAAKKTTYADLQPGDLVFYKEDGEISHVAFYIGKITYRGEQHHTAIVHAATRKDGICVSPLYAGERKYGTYWR